MKKYFLTIFILGLIFYAYSVSALYQGTIGVAVGNSTASITIGEIPSVNVTNNSGTTGGETGGTTTPTAQPTGGSSRGTRNNFLSSIKGLFTDDEEEKEDSPKKQDEETDETPKEETIFSSFMNAAVIGVSDFVKTPAGIATFTIVGLFVVGGITFLAVKGKFKKLLPKKEENTTEQ